jgi:pimeloyl-ACP methyl ester carboxylesterase
MEKKKIKNVVLVHGAFSDGSGFKGLYWELTRQGYNVTVVQNPLTSLEDDVLATETILDRLDGPTVLAGHSWGGVVITEAGNHRNVAALVYIAAFQPDNGETAQQWFETMPPAPENGMLPADENGIVYYDKEKFHAGFCADIDVDEALFLYASQGAFYAKGLATPISNAAWRHKPSFGVVATMDKSIDPDIQRNMYARSETRYSEIDGSHALYMSQPKEVAKIINYAVELIA